MKLSRLIGLIFFGVFWLPMILAHGQEKDLKVSPILMQIVDLEHSLRRNNELETRMRAMTGLRDIYARTHDVVSAIVQHGLQDGDEELRIKAAIALAQIGPSAVKGTSAVQALVTALEKDKAPRVRIQAASALGYLFEDGNNPQHAAPAIAALRRAMNTDGDTLVRRSACRALGFAGPNSHEAMPDLLELMKTKEDDFFRELAMQSFADAACPAAKKIVPTLLEILKKGTNDPAIEVNILWALGKIGEPEEKIVPVLVETLKKPQCKEARGGALIAIMEMGPKAKGATPALVAALQTSNGEGKEKESATLAVLRAIEAIGHDAADALPAVRKLAGNPKGSRRIRDKCEEVMKRLEKEKVVGSH